MADLTARDTWAGPRTNCAVTLSGSIGAAPSSARFHSAVRSSSVGATASVCSGTSADQPGSQVAAPDQDQRCRDPTQRAQRVRGRSGQRVDAGADQSRAAQQGLPGQHRDQFCGVGAAGQRVQVDGQHRSAGDPHRGGAQGDPGARYGFSQVDQPLAGGQGAGQPGTVAHRFHVDEQIEQRRVGSVVTE